MEWQIVEDVAMAIILPLPYLLSLWVTHPKGKTIDLFAPVGNDLDQ